MAKIPSPRGWVPWLFVAVLTAALIHFTITEPGSVMFPLLGVGLVILARSAHSRDNRRRG